MTGQGSMLPRRLAPLVLPLAALSCSAGAPAPAPLPAPPRPQVALVPLVHPARYLVPDAAWIERVEGAVDRVVANGRRMEVRGVETVRLGPAEPEVSGGAVAPPWAGSGPARYVFWKGRELYGAETFTGELRKIATLPGEPQRAFDWLSGTGLLLSGGAVVVPASGGAPAPIQATAVTHALAADARRALTVSALGHARLTVDGGASFRDISAALGQVSALEVRGDELVATLFDDRERFINGAGAITESRAAPGLLRGKPPADALDLWPPSEDLSALAAAVRGGLPLPDGGAVVASRSFVGRLDLASLRTTSVAPLAGVGEGAECVAFRAADVALLACAGLERATVIDISGAPRVERTFDLSGAPDLDRFTGADGEAIGYLGPCDGSPPRALPTEAAFGSEEANTSPSRSEVFCVRKGREEWIEHRLEPVDASDVVAWIPRVSGGAVALVARSGTFLRDEERIAVRGGLRIVRVARNEPPLSFPPYGARSTLVLSRWLRVRADDVIEGFIPAASTLNAMAVKIDERGHARAFASPPRASQIFVAGLQALAESEDGRLFETVNSGQRWVEIQPPPGAAFTSPSQCSPVGCQVGPFVRLGWSGAGEGAPPPDPDPARMRAARERNQFQRPPGASPLVRLACGVAGPPQGKRASELFGFGVVAWNAARGAMPVRLGALGVAMFPWNGPQVATSGDIDVGWVAPLDLTGAIRRASLPFGRTGLSAISQRSYEVKLGYMVDAQGGLDLFSVGHREACLAGLLDAVGITRSLGACADEPSIGVDLGGKVLVIHLGSDALITSAADAPLRRKEPTSAQRRGARPAEAARALPETAGTPVSMGLTPVALHELARTPIGTSTRSFTFGAGVREGAPVVVAVDVHGAAILSPIDPERGTLGPEEPLRPLTAVALGSDAACASSSAGGAGEARVVLPLNTEIGLDRASLRGVFATGGAGIAVLRWSKARACLDAVEIAVRDERFEAELGPYGPYDPPGTVRKIVARFAGAGAKAPAGAALLLISNGMELRQPLTCSRVLVGTGEGDAP